MFDHHKTRLENIFINKKKGLYLNMVKTPIASINLIKYETMATEPLKVILPQLDLTFRFVRHCMLKQYPKI